MAVIPVVITPLDYHMGVDMARSLGRRGVPVYGVDANPSQPGRLTRYARYIVSPDQGKSKGEFVQFLIDLGKKLGKAVLFAVRDDEVMIISEYRESLKAYYEIVMPDHAAITTLLTKDGLRRAALEYGIPVPYTAHPRSVSEVAAIAANIEFPVILKPTESLLWHSPEITALLGQGAISGRAKVVLCHTADELLMHYQRIAVHDDRMIVQEVIPGGDDQLVYFASYSNRTSEIIASFAGRKMRIVPPGFGSASYVKTIRDDELYRLSAKLLSGVKYQGLSGIEFKRDPRDSLYKLVEVNARFGIWDGLSIKVGIDLPWVAYQDAIGRRVEPRYSYPEGVIWVDLFRDCRSFLAYRRRGEITLGGWVNSLRGEKMIATFARDDPLPLFSTGWYLASRLVKRCLRG